MKEFLNSFSPKPSVVDLGCGDFSIGSKLINTLMQMAITLQ